MGIANIDRYEGALLGVAVGDAMGAPLEFMSAAEIQRKHGYVREMLGGGWLNVLPGEVTDDTQMTLAVAEGIAGSDGNLTEAYRAVGENFLRWYGTHPKDVGGCCSAVLSKMERSETSTITDWHNAAKEWHRQSNGGTAGNGALMRAVYPALYYKRDEAQEAAAAIAKMTHWHEHSTLTVQRYTDAVNTIVNSDMTAKKARETAETMLADIRELAKGRTVEPTGYCVDSLICAMNAIRDTTTFEDAVAAAVNLGGDADTIGAITGGLAGAIYGANHIPLRWLNKLENEPNTRTVGIFRYVSDPTGNVLLRRLIDLAQRAYSRHHSIFETA